MWAAPASVTWSAGPSAAEKNCVKLSAAGAQGWKPPLESRVSPSTARGRVKPTMSSGAIEWDDASTGSQPTTAPIRASSAAASTAAAPPEEWPAVATEAVSMAPDRPDEVERAQSRAARTPAASSCTVEVIAPAGSMSATSPQEARWAQTESYCETSIWRPPTKRTSGKEPVATLAPPSREGAQRVAPTATLTCPVTRCTAKAPGPDGSAGPDDAAPPPQEPRARVRVRARSGRRWLGVPRRLLAASGEARYRGV